MKVTFNPQYSTPQIQRTNYSPQSRNSAPMQCDSVSFGHDMEIKAFNALKKEVAELTAKQDFDGVLKKFGIEISWENGKKVLSHYTKPKNCTFAELGVKDNDLLKDVVEIKKTLFLSDSKDIILPALKKAENIDIYYTKNANLSAVAEAENVDVGYSENITLSALKEAVDIDLCNAQNVDMSALRKAYYIDLRNSSNVNLSALEEVDQLIGLGSAINPKLPDKFLKK